MIRNSVEAGGEWIIASGAMEARWHCRLEGVLPFPLTQTLSLMEMGLRVTIDKVGLASLRFIPFPAGRKGLGGGRFSSGCHWMTWSRAANSLVALVTL